MMFPAHFLIPEVQVMDSGQVEPMIFSVHCTLYLSRLVADSNGCAEN